VLSMVIILLTAVWSDTVPQCWFGWLLTLTSVCFPMVKNVCHFFFDLLGFSVIEELKGTCSIDSHIV